MIGNALSSFFDNLSTKTKNPFLGTFAIVWLCRNWELVFSLFNFDDSYTLESKINFLSARIKYETFWSELGVNILWTFFVLIATYALINLARVVTNLFEKHLTPLIYKWTADSQSIYLKEDYLRLKKLNEELEKRVDQERDEKLKAKSEVETLEKKIQDQLNNVTDINQENKSLDKQSSKNKSNRFQSTPILINPTTDVEKNFESLINEYGLSHIKKIQNLILENEPIDYNEDYEIIDFLLENGFILLKEKGKNEKNTYKLTNPGASLFKMYFS